MREKGVAFLETAMISVLLITMLMAGIALSTFYHKSYEINHLLDKYIVDGVVAPLRIQQDGTLAVNAQPLRDYVDRIVAAIEQEIVIGDSDTGYLPVPANRYRVEAGYSVVSIDSASGAALGFIGGAVAYQKSSAGTLALAGADLNALAQSALNAPTLAQPGGSFDPGVSTKNFIETTVLLVARVGFHSKGGLTEDFLGSLGLSPVLSDSRVIALRAIVE